MNALELVARSVARPFVRAAAPNISMDEWAQMWSLDGLQGMLSTTLRGDREEIEGSFAGLISGAYSRHGVIFACMMSRYLLFSEARFQFQQMRSGRPGQLFGTADLGVLERPEPGKTTGDLLARAILDVDGAGNSFSMRRPDRIKRLRPDWMTIVLGSRRAASELGAWDPDAEVIGYGYNPGGHGSGEDPIAFGPDEIAHFAPYPDPLAQYRGMSWLTPILREVMADQAATSHKLAYFRNAATPNLALKLPAGMSKTKAEEWIALFDQEHKGALNAYKTLWFGGGVEPLAVGSTMQQLTFKELQGSAETRIAAAAGLSPVIVPLSEGLAGSSLNAGNFGSAARLVGDKTLRPLWRNIAGSFESIVPPLPGTRLWYDPRDVAFLRADVKDEAETHQVWSTAITTYVKEGFTPESAVDAVVSGDLTRLQHSGLVSVQLQPPGQTLAPPAAQALVAALMATRDLRSSYGGVREGSRTSIREFWPASGPLSVMGSIEEGTELPADHPLVLEFPSLFARRPMVTVSRPERILLGSGPAPIVSREAVLTKRAELHAAGRPHGYDTLARELGVSAATVRRRLAD